MMKIQKTVFLALCLSFIALSMASSGSDQGFPSNPIGYVQEAEHDLIMESNSNDEGEFSEPSDDMMTTSGDNTMTEQDFYMPRKDVGIPNPELPMELTSPTESGIDEWEANELTENMPTPTPNYNDMEEDLSESKDDMPMSNPDLTTENMPVADVETTESFMTESDDDSMEGLPMDFNEEAEGGWSKWKLLSRCSAPCGGTGVRVKVRTCIKEVLANGEDGCPGENTKTVKCRPGRRRCPEEGGRRENRRGDKRGNRRGY